jgi:hypothetical protein
LIGPDQIQQQAMARRQADQPSGGISAGDLANVAIDAYGSANKSSSGASAADDGSSEGLLSGLTENGGLLKGIIKLVL